MNSTSAPPRAQQAPYDAESLLAVSARIFTERGYDGTSMRHLADAAGITKSSFYYHVSGKEELLKRALDRSIGALCDVLENARREHVRAIDRLEAVLRGSVHLLAAELPYVTLLLRVRGNSEIERAALERRREFDLQLAALAAQAAAEGDLRRDVPPAVLTRLLFGMINSLIEWYEPGGEIAAEDLAGILVETLFHGIHGVPECPS